MVVIEELAKVTGSRQAISPKCLKIANIVVTGMILIDGVLGFVYSVVLSV